MKKTQLDKEEQALLAAFESGDLHSARRYCIRNYSNVIRR